MNISSKIKTTSLLAVALFSVASPVLASANTSSTSTPQVATTYGKEKMEGAIYRVFDKKSKSHRLVQSSVLMADTKNQLVQEGDAWGVFKNVNTVKSLFGDWSSYSFYKMGQTVYEYYNKSLNRYIYVTSKAEMSSIEKMGYRKTGYNFVSGGTVPVYRVYNKATKEHLFTVDEVEAKTLAKRGWSNEGVAFSVLTTSTNFD